MVFLEQNVAQQIGIRQARWWVAYGGTSAYLPLVMIDSGHTISSGPLDFVTVYKRMVDAELPRPPGARIAAFARRLDNTMKVYTTVTNLAGVALSSSANAATVNALVWEDKKVGVTSTIVRAAPYVTIAGPLAPGTSASFVLVTPALSSVDWTKLHTLVAVDYRPGSSGPYDLLQAAIALPTAMTAQPSAVTLRAVPTDPAAAQATVELSGPHVIRWTASTEAAWLEVSPASGTLPAQVAMTLLPDRMPTGPQETTISLTGRSDDGLQLSCEVAVQAERLASERPLRQRLTRRP